jgi:hypothetical protein
MEDAKHEARRRPYERPGVVTEDLPLLPLVELGSGGGTTGGTLSFPGPGKKHPPPTN